MRGFRLYLLNKTRNSLTGYTTLNDISRIERILEDILKILESIIKELDSKK